MIDAERRERVHYGVGDGRWGAVGAAFADAFDAQRIKGIGVIVSPRIIGGMSAARMTA
jgi:hypothetical protein